MRRLQAQFLRQGEGFWERPERGGRRHQNLTREEEAHLLRSFLPSAEQGGLLVGINAFGNECSVSHDPTPNEVGESARISCGCFVEPPGCSGHRLD